MKRYAFLAGCLFTALATLQGQQAQAKTATTTAVTASSPSFAYGAAVTETFTATVTGATGDGEPTGTIAVTGSGTLGALVTITMNATNCSAINGYTRQCTGMATIPAGQAVADYTITAKYSADTTYKTSSGTTTVDIVQADPTAHISSASSAYGSTVTLTATNTGAAAGAAPTGAASFTVAGIATGGTPACTSSGSVRTCTLSYTLPPALTGNAGYVTRVTFAADTNYASSTDTATLTVTRATATAAISSVSGGYQEKVALTLSETGLTGYAAPTGAPSITVGTVTQKAKKACTATGDVDNCTTTYHGRATQPQGTYTITVTFAADTNYKQAVGTGTLTVTLASSMIVVTADPPNLERSGTTTLTGTVTNLTHEADVPTGTVTFTAGATNLGSCTLSGGYCSVTVNGSSLPGSREVTVTGAYGGVATEIAGSNGTVLLTVPADIAFTSVTHTFGTVPVGDATTYGVQLSNNDSTAFPFALTLTGPSTITEQTSCKASVPANSVCEILFTYTPTAAAGLETATWSVANPNDLIFSPSDGGTLKGSGVATAGVTLTTNGHDFGPEDVGTSSDVYGTVLTNGTANALQVAITQTDTTDFITYANTCPATLEEYQSCNLQFYFEPQSTGFLLDTVGLSVTLNGNPVTITAGGQPSTGIKLDGTGQ